MLNRSLLSSVSTLTFAKNNDEGASETKATQDVVKTVYISGEKSLEAVKLHVMNAADATLSLIAAMVVHLVVRNYHHSDQERRDFATTKKELLSAFQEFAEAKRGKPFEHAWLSRLLNASYSMGRALLTDYARKGITGPIVDVLRAKSPDKAIDIVLGFIKQKTKGASAFTALEKALTFNKKAPAAGSNATPNAVKASTDKPERIGAALVSDKGFEAINAIKGNAKVKAIKMADTMAKTNVDHLTFVMRALLNLTAEECIMVAQAATDRAKELNAAKTEAPVKRSRRAKTDQDNGEGGIPAAAAAIVAG